MAKGFCTGRARGLTFLRCCTAAASALLARLPLYWWIRSSSVSLVDASMRLPMLLRLLWLLLARVAWCMSRRLTSPILGVPILGVPPSPSCSAPAQSHALQQAASRAAGQRLLSLFWLFLPALLLSIPICHAAALRTGIMNSNQAWVSHFSLSHAQMRSDATGYCARVCLINKCRSFEHADAMP